MNSLATALVRGQLQGRGLLIDRDAGLTVCQPVPNGTTKRDCSWPVFTRSRFPSRNLPFVRHRGLYTFEACRLTLVPVLSQKWPRSSCRVIWRSSGPLWLRRSRCFRFANRGSASDLSCQDCGGAAIFQGATCCCGKGSRSTWAFPEPWFNGFGST